MFIPSGRKQPNQIEAKSRVGLTLGRWNVSRRDRCMSLSLSLRR